MTGHALFLFACRTSGQAKTKGRAEKVKTGRPWAWYSTSLCLSHRQQMDQNLPSLPRHTCHATCCKRAAAGYVPAWFPRLTQQHGVTFFLYGGSTSLHLCLYYYLLISHDLLLPQPFYHPSSLLFTSPTSSTTMPSPSPSVH